MLALILGLALASGVQSALSIAGMVLDATGAAISGATVRLEVAGTPVNEMQTATDGRFSFRRDVDSAGASAGASGGAGAGAGAVRVIVSAAGFASATVDVDRAAGELRIVLEPARFFEAVNVTSTRTDVP